jgi:hypothetical protein
MATRAGAAGTAGGPLVDQLDEAPRVLLFFGRVVVHLGERDLVFDHPLARRGSGGFIRGGGFASGHRVGCP